MKKWNSFLITILYFSLNACSLPNQSDEKLPLVAYCDLVATPSKYDGQEVRVRANHIVGFEWSYLTDEKCSDKSSDDSQTWIVIADNSWCEGVKQTNISFPTEYNRGVVLEREVIVIGTFNSTRGGPVGQFSMELICLEKAAKWQVVR